MIMNGGSMGNKKGLIRAIEAAKATPFQRRVWRTILSIPRGEVRSYSWVAQKIGNPRAVRAVGNALNRNPFAPDVPCHRVVRKDGSIGGFAGGTEKKTRLLRKEGLNPGTKSLPPIIKKRFQSL